MLKKGFTLIELLIVVAIIAILAAIAVPNFLEAQVRSKVSRAKADMRTIALGAESYRVDHNIYPYPIMPETNFQLVTELSTPIAYITSYPPDVFPLCIGWGSDELNYPNMNFDKPYRNMGYKYFSLKFTGKKSPEAHTWFDLMYKANAYGTPPSKSRSGFVITCTGPDNRESALEWMAIDYLTDKKIDGVYDPTNGTVSNGDIGRIGGESHPFAQGVLISK